MLIVSKFHDYYDTAMSYGIDKTCVYNRETVESVLDRRIYSLPYSAEWNLSGGKILAEGLIVGFCGKIYPAIKVSFSVWIGNAEKPMFFYTPEDFTSFINTRIDFPESKGKRWFYWHGRGDLRNEKGVKDFFNDDFKKLESFFLEYKVPIFSIEATGHNAKLVLNPRLENYYFMKTIDPATAFQEVYMFKAGVLGNTEVETIDISDKDRIQQHGFDKHSFRTMKGDKKPRAKNRGKNE